MVLGSGTCPFTEPRLQRHQPTFARPGMAAHDFPLVGGETALLGKDLRGNVELADVVQERGPMELARTLRIECELLADEVRIGAHALTVPRVSRSCLLI